MFHAVAHSRFLFSKEPSISPSTTEDTLSTELFQGGGTPSGRNGGLKKKRKAEQITNTTPTTFPFFFQMALRFSGFAKLKKNQKIAAKKNPKYMERVWERRNTRKERKRAPKNKKLIHFLVD